MDSPCSTASRLAKAFGLDGPNLLSFEINVTAQDYPKVTAVYLVKSPEGYERISRDFRLVPTAGAVPEPQAPKVVRPPYSRDYVECVCGACAKDDCCCIRETMRSNIATAASGVALSAKTA